MRVSLKVVCGRLGHEWGTGYHPPVDLAVHFVGN
jgi:hypothetical protein